MPRTLYLHKSESHCFVKTRSYPLSRGVFRVAGVMVESGHQGWARAEYMLPDSEAERESYRSPSPTNGRSPQWLQRNGEKSWGWQQTRGRSKKKHWHLSALSVLIGTSDLRAKLWRWFCCNDNALRDWWEMEEIDFGALHTIHLPVFFHSYLCVKCLLSYCQCICLWIHVSHSPPF